MTDPLRDDPEGTLWRNVRMSETLFRELGASRVDWGEPDADGFYTPTLYAAVTDPLREAAPIVIDYLDSLLTAEALSMAAILRYGLRESRLAVTPAPALDVERLARALVVVATAADDEDDDGVVVFIALPATAPDELADLIACAYEEADRG